MSNQKCCVPGCAASSGTHETLHKFPNPVKDKERFNKWVYSISGDLLGLNQNHIFKYRRVCHRHFEEKYLCRSRRLSNTAIPTVIMPDVISRLKLPVEERLPLRQIQNTDFTSRPSTSKECSSKTLNLTSLVPPNVENTKINVQERTIDTPKGSLQTKGLVSSKLRKNDIVTSSENALYKKLVQVAVKLCKCRNKIKSQRKKMKILSNITQNPSFCKTLENLTSTARILTLLQFREYKKESKGRRFSLEEKLVALSILKQSPKGYRFLRRIFILPAPQTLQKLINMADIKAGINKNIMQQLKKKIQLMKTEERLCVLLFDEMSLKANVTYNERKDKVVGFVTNGEETIPEFADHVQVFMVRGLMKNYKQPVCYTFSQSATKGPEIAKQLKAVVKALQAAGLIIVATICDQGTNNTQCIKMLVEETKASILRRGLDPRENIIIIDNAEIIPLYDPPHLMKCIRNNLLTKDLKYLKNNELKFAKWSHIQKLHQENPGYKGIRLIPKLTDSHVVPQKIAKMKVKFATQLFSQTVGTNMGYLADKGILPAECKDTADILIFFDNLFDSLNGSFKKKHKHGKPLLGAATPNSVHNKIWEESKQALKNMKFINSKTGEVERVPTLNNWVWTLEGIQLLLKKLKSKYGIFSVWLRGTLIKTLLKIFLELFVAMGAAT